MSTGFYMRNKWSSCSAWPRWYFGFCNGKFGVGIVRETWGWRFMLGVFDLCIHTDEVKK